MLERRLECAGGPGLRGGKGRGKKSRQVQRGRSDTSEESHTRKIEGCHEHAAEPDYLYSPIPNTHY